MCAAFIIIKFRSVGCFFPCLFDSKIWRLTKLGSSNAGSVIGLKTDKQLNQEGLVYKEPLREVFGLKV